MTTSAEIEIEQMFLSLWRQHSSAPFTAREVRFAYAVFKKALENPEKAKKMLDEQVLSL